MLDATPTQGPVLASLLPPYPSSNPGQAMTSPPTHATDSRLIKAKRSKASRVVFSAYNAGCGIADHCLVRGEKAKSRLRRKVDKAVAKVDKTVDRVKDACMESGLQVVRKLSPAFNRVPALGPAATAADNARLETKQRLDTDIAQLRTYKKSFKDARQKLKATVAKAGRLQAAAQKHRSEARSRLEKGCADLCRDLSALSVEQVRKRSGQNVEALRAVFQKAKQSIGLTAEPTVDETAKAMDRLWQYAHDEARAASLESELGKQRRAIDRGAYLDTVIGECRTLQEQGRALARELPADLAPWAEAKLSFEQGHVATCQAFLQEKAMIDRLPNPAKHGWIEDMPGRLNLLEPSSADIKHFMKSHVARSLRELPDSAFDDIWRIVAPGGSLGTLLVHSDPVKAADILDAWRDAVQEECVRRYETGPLHALAELSELIESNALQGMSDHGLHAAEVPLPEQHDFYLHARNAVHGLLRGMCLARHGEEGRTQYLSRLIFEGADPADRAKLMGNTTWMQPQVFRSLMEHIERITPNTDLMGSQYRRLLQEMQVVLKGNVLAASSGGMPTGYRRLSDFDRLDGALPGKARGALRQAWDKVKFWGGYALLNDGFEKEAKRFAYHQSHVDKRLREWVDLMSRDSADSRATGRAYGDFLVAADDLRSEFDIRQFRDTACDEYLRLEFSRAVSRLGARGIKNLYKNLQRPCPDMRTTPPRFAIFADLQGWWRNKFWNGERATPRDSVQWQRAATRCWNELRSAVEQEPEARNYAYQLQSLASKFSRPRDKDYQGMRAALDEIIKSDGTTWSSPSADSFTAYDAAWARINPKLMKNLLARLDRYERHMDDFLKGDDVMQKINEENRFMYRYILEGLRKSGKAFMENDPLNRYARFGVAAAEDTSIEDAAEALPESTATVPTAASGGDSDSAQGREESSVPNSTPG